jgi:hypothetical protein
VKLAAATGVVEALVEGRQCQRWHGGPAGSIDQGRPMEACAGKSSKGRWGGQREVDRTAMGKREGRGRGGWGLTSMEGSPGLLLLWWRVRGRVYFSSWSGS